MYGLVRPLLFQMDPENAHGLVKRVSKLADNPLGLGLVKAMYAHQDPRLQVEAMGIRFPNPVGLAAGFDKDAEMVNFMAALGFGFVEIGSVTAKARYGNQRPRLFRLPKDEALINRMGLNNQGADVVAERLDSLETDAVVGVNITKTHDPRIMGGGAIDDFGYSFAKFLDLGHYKVVNISCPNTEEGKTFEDRGPLSDLLVKVREARVLSLAQPWLLKLSPDLSREALDAILDLGSAHGIDGYVICNTSSSRKRLVTHRSRLDEIGKGGLSGAPLYLRSVAMLNYVAKGVPGATLISVGGVDSAWKAYGHIVNGASLVQVYTGLVYKGPSLPGDINRGIVGLLEQDGFSSIQEAIGSRL